MAKLEIQSNESHAQTPTLNVIFIKLAGKFFSYKEPYLVSIFVSLFIYLRNYKYEKNTYKYGT